MNSVLFPIRRIALLAATVLAAIVLSTIAAGGLQAQEVGRLPEARFTDTGTDGCLRCHGGDSMLVMGETAHGRTDNPHAPYAQQGCESCHGPGSLHVSRSRGGAGFPPLARFGRGGDEVAAQLQACLGCHGTEMGDHPGIEWAGSLHDTGRMTCSTCHQLHTSGNVLATREQQADSCGRCHGEQITNHNRFENRGIIWDRLTCHDCHDPHQLMRRP